ncbi:hypothetical protein ACOMHN_052049 [Nucella lapillus]
MSSGRNDKTDTPHHHHHHLHPSSGLAAATSLHVPDPQRSQSSGSSQRSSDQSKSRASTRQSDMSSSTTSNWTSVTGISQSSTGSSSLKPYFYPTSGYPVSSSILQKSYPGNGYPVSHLNHSYGYPANNFPCCEVPGVVDLGSQVTYPSSEFPGGGVFPGEVDQDDGFAPFTGGLESAGFPSGDISTLPSSDSLYTPGSFDSNYYHPGYPV